MAKESEYQGNPMLVLTEDNARFPFQFGLGKAVKIVENYDAIVAFVKKHQKAVESKKAEYKAKIVETIAKEQESIEKKNARLAELKRQAESL